MKTLTLTRRASPEDLQEDSDWQNGPVFLRQPVEEWSKKSAAEAAAGARASLNKLQRRSFSMALTRAQAERELALQNNLDGKNHATASWLGCQRTCREQEVQQFNQAGQSHCLSVESCNKMENEMLSHGQGKAQKKGSESKKTNKQTVISVGVGEDALRDLVLEDQKSVSFSDTALSRLAVYKDEKSGHQMDSYWPTRDSLH